ncbi:MAG: HNH endonuclease [Veillonellaceae bacterium]|nr:HNH endonuclease [Veillonellaceae bacterium]
MYHCWRNNEPITKKNESKEHIIPNALCGKRKPKTLLCDTCNNELHFLDRRLSEDLDFILANLSCKRDSGSAPPIIAVSSDGTEYKMKNGKAKLKDPVFPDSPTVAYVDGKKTEIYNIVARSLDEAHAMVEGLKKKYPDKDFVVEMKKIEVYLDSLNTNSIILSDESFRAIAKIAVNFYMWKVGKKGNIEGAIDYVNGLSKEEIVGIYYNEEAKNLKDCEIAHILYIKGDKEEKILYCYVSLFGAIDFIVLLNDDYNDENYEELYSLNVETRHEDITRFELSLTNTQIKEIINDELPIEDLKRGLGKTNRIIEAKNVLNAVADIITEHIANNNLDTIAKLINEWDNIKSKIDSYPHLATLHCPYQVEVRTQPKLKCDCGLDQTVYMLVSLNISGTVFLQIQIYCNMCGKIFSSHEVKEHITS